MSKVVPRDVSWILQAFRNALFGRKYQSQLRFEDFNFSKRTQPKAEIPGGVSHKLKDNYYFNRDARRVLKPAETIYIAPQETTQTPQLKP